MRGQQAREFRMRKRTVLGRFVGPPDETLKQIGMVIVMAARLDYERMLILERTAGVPVEESANLSRRALTKQLKDSVRREPLNRLEAKLNEWLREVNDLLNIRDWLAHSETYHQVWGDGRRGHFMMRPRTGQVRPAFTFEKLEEVVDRLGDAGHEGWRLMMDLGTLAHDEAAYDANLEVHAQVEAAWAEMDAEAERLRKAGG
jgi:hypothetical protein